MQVEPLKIHGMFKLSPKVHEDERGAFFRAFCEDTLDSNGIKFGVKQTNVSINPHLHTMRGFHFQKSPSEESKIITCVSGAIYNVSIDLRPKSSSFLNVQYCVIDSQSSVSILLPSGCANAFLTTKENTFVYYLMSANFSEGSYSGFRFDDPAFNVRWPSIPAVISERDLSHPRFNKNVI